MSPMTFFPRAVMSLGLALVSASAAAQQPPPPQGPHAQPTRESTTIVRHTDQVSNVGSFREDTPRRPTTPAPNGDVGSTGAVAERRPDSELRGSTGPAPGEIDMTHPIGAADVARIVRAYEPRLRPCYDRARATRPTLAGRVNMRFVIGRDGTLSNVDVTGLPEAPEVATCVREELQRSVFPRPESGTLPFATGMNFAPPVPATPPRGRGRGARPAPRH